MKYESHDQNFKNLFFDFPKEALEFFLPEAYNLGKLKNIEFDRQEPQKHHLKDSHLSLDMPIIFHFELKTIILWLVEFQEDKDKFSIYRLIKYTVDKSEVYPDYAVIPTVLFTDRKAWKKQVKKSLQTKIFDRLFFHFEYVFIKLFDYRARDYFHVPNPLVKILLPKMNYEKHERWEVIRQAYLGLYALVSTKLFDKYSYFIDTYSEIDDDEKKNIENEIYENKETVMIAQYFREQGQEIGLKIGEMAIICNQLAKRFNVDKESVAPQLKELESNDLLKLGDMILDYDSFDPIYKWINERIKKRVVE